MVSSTFKDLKSHREALIRALHKETFASDVMENNVAKADGDVIESSIQMVRDAAAYIVLIGMRYGQTPECPRRNPKGLSITELEFNEAQRIGRPILLFIMSEDHAIKKADVERDPMKEAQLDTFRERAKKSHPDSLVNRVYSTFTSLEDFTEQAIHAVAGLRRLLEKPTPLAKTLLIANKDFLPSPPEFYAEPPYGASHKFVGRASELNTLSDWASPADSYPIFLFDAIGGSGKSMLTWEWTKNHALGPRQDWAGRLWYSFYERGAVMADFCHHALAYITQEPLESFTKQKTTELSRQLLHHLQTRPWLLVLDGLERILVAYNRSDAAELSDEEASSPTDQIAHRDPCSAIRPEDDDLLRTLAIAAPSKLLITTRLPPRALLNTADQPRPGVRRSQLRGLRPSDAEALLRACGIKGNSRGIQTYLQNHCDCHPLTIGVLAGLIQHYLPDKENFDTWAADPDYGGHLDLADLDLVQKRNHILKAAIAGLSPESRQLLSILALLSEGIDYPALSALNPYLPPEPDEVEKPNEPWVRSWWSEERKQEERQQYEAAFERWKDYMQALEAWRRSPELRAAHRQLERTVLDLQSRGLIQYDNSTRRYDLHPVVRGVAAGGLEPDEKEKYGMRVVDYFSSKAHSPYEHAETFEDVRDGIHIFRTLLKMERYQEAYEAFEGDLSSALSFNLEADAVRLALIRPFFRDGWAKLPNFIPVGDSLKLLNSAGTAFLGLDEINMAIMVFSLAAQFDIRAQRWSSVLTGIGNIGESLRIKGRLAKLDHCLSLASDIASLTGSEEDKFGVLLARFKALFTIGSWAEAQTIWQSLNSMGRNWSRAKHRPGDVEYYFARLCLYHGGLSADQLVDAEQLARKGKNRPTIRNIYQLRGQWLLEQGDWGPAAENLREAVSLARAVDKTDSEAEVQLALARFHLGQLSNPREEAEQFLRTEGPTRRFLGLLWLAIGDREMARKHAVEAYKWAWADGEPYVRRYELEKTHSLFEHLGAEIPQLKPYDPATYEKFPWEDDLVAAIEKLRAEKEAESKPDSPQPPRN